MKLHYFRRSVGWLLLFGVLAAAAAPPTVYQNNYTGETTEVRDGINRTIYLLVPFHGNHPAYNVYVGERLRELISSRRLFVRTIEQLHDHLNQLIDQALRSGKS